MTTDRQDGPGLGCLLIANRRGEEDDEPTDKGKDDADDRQDLEMAKRRRLLTARTRRS